MTDSSKDAPKTASVDFMEKLGFELSDDVVSFYVDGHEIVFTIQSFDELSDCNFQVSNSEERLPLNDEQLQMLNDAGYTDPEGYLIDI